MSKAFTREGDDDIEDDVEEASPLPAGARNYMTPGGFARLKAELNGLVDKQRPEVVATVAWAASNGDRSENGDYIYGKKRLREIDRRIRFLTKRLGSAVVVDPADRGETEQIFFGATVTYVTRAGVEHTVSIVGMDEVDTKRGRVSWISPIAKALLDHVDRLLLPSEGGDTFARRYFEAIQRQPAVVLAHGAVRKLLKNG